MRRSFGFVAIFAALMFYSCSAPEKTTAPEPGNQHATVTMKDGTTTSGNVVTSSKTEITLAGDDKITRTIPMDQVKSIEYSEATAAAPAAPENSGETTTAAPAETPAPVSGATPVAPLNLTASKTQAPSGKGTAVSQTAEKSRRELELPLGTKIAVRTDEEIDSSKVAEGQTFAAEVTKDVLDGSGTVVIPARSSAQVAIKSATQGGRIRGASDLVVDLQSVTIDGQRHRLETTDISKAGKSGIGANKRTATYTGGGAAVGAIIGAIAGGGKGAAIGAASGAGAGALTQIVTKGKSIKIPAETILTFRLAEPVRVSR